MFSSNRQKEWHPEPSFKFKWNNPLYLLVGFLFLTSTCASAQVTPLTKIYSVYCLDDRGRLSQGNHPNRQSALDAAKNYEANYPGGGRNTQACSIGIQDVTPLTDAEFEYVRHKP